MPLTNCTVTQNGTANIAGGSPVGTKIIDMIVSPSAGYVITAKDCTVGNGVPTASGVYERDINSVSFDQTGTSNDAAIKKVVVTDTGTGGAPGNTVKLEVHLEESYVMPASNTALTIDIDLVATSITRTLTFSVIEPLVSAYPNQTITTAFETTENSTNYGITQSSENDNSPSTGLRTTVYSVADTVDTNKIILTKTYEADTNYFYNVDPYWENTSNVAEPPFDIQETKTDDSDGDTTKNVFVIKFKMPALAQSSTIRFYSEAGTAKSASMAKEIENYVISASDIPMAGEKRGLTTHGVSAAKFNLTITDKGTGGSGTDTYDFTTNTFTASATSLADAEIGTQLAGNKGWYDNGTIEFPPHNASGTKTYQLLWAAGTASSLSSGFPTNPLVLTQNGQSTTTFSIVNTDSALSPTSLGTAKTVTGDAGEDNINSPGTFTHTFNVTDDATFYLRRQPLSSDFSNQDSNGLVLNPGSVTTDKSTNHGAGSTGMTSLAITVTDARVDEYPTADVTCSIDLDDIVNSAPVAVAEGYSVNEDAVLTIPLADKASDADSDTLTYAIVADNTSSNGTLSLNTTSGVATYTPVANNNTNTSFTWKCNDGYQDSNTVTASITVNPMPDKPTGIALSANTQAENTATNTDIGTLTSTGDPDGSGTYTYTLVETSGTHPDGAKFNINGDKLRNSVIFDYENPVDANTNNEYVIKVRSTDADGSGYVEAEFTITVTDVAEGTYQGVGATNVGGGASTFLLTSIGPSTGTPALTTTPANILATGYGGGATGAPGGTSFTAKYRFFGNFDSNQSLDDHAVTINRVDAAWITVTGYDTQPDSITIVAGTTNSFIEGDITFDINQTMTSSTTSSNLGFTGTDVLDH